jgi:alpha-glucuronidase
MMKKITSLAGFGVALGLVGMGSKAQAQTADEAWLKYRPLNRRLSVPMRVEVRGQSRIERSAASELVRGLRSLAGGSSPEVGPDSIVLATVEELSREKSKSIVPKPEPEEFQISWSQDQSLRELDIVGGSERGLLYGVFALLRHVAEGADMSHAVVRENPAMSIRWVDEWDNADGSIERGYAGRSTFFESGKVRDDLKPVAEYARLLASVGINGCNVNNVNNAAPFLNAEMLKGLARIADAMRPWGVRLAISVDVASPQKIGGLKTYDPLDPAVQAWWKAKVDEIYRLIPDFAGFTVKADSEGQPGPASYGRTPADAANTLAAALEPHGGVVLYRAFVYNHHLDWNDPKADRARAAYDIFHPLDGKFASNVIVQIKEGPIDFQVREPVSPLFGGLPHTQKAMEVQITQEYLGQQRHLVYLGSKWQWVLYQQNLLASAAREANPGASEGLTGMVGVACVGRDGWLGSPLAMANLYAFGRLAWDPSIQMRAAKIAEEWTRQTISNDPDVVRVVDDMLLGSWRTYERYTGPLGLQTLTDIVGSHYGPNVEASENNGWGQWHRADHEGVGMDRTVATGTGFVGQYPPDIARLYENPDSTVSGLLLFFHHLPYTFRLHNGKTIIQAIYDMHYLAAEEAGGFVKQWESLKGNIDPALYANVLPRLEYQAGHAIVWRDAVVQYFWKLSGIADEQGRAGNFPGRMEAEDAKLSGYQVIDVKPWEDASRGEAVTCAAPAKGAAAAKSCSAEWTYSGAAGVLDVAVDYFDLQGGVAKFAVTVNDKPASVDAEWSADAMLPSQRPNGDNSTRHVVHDVTLKPGDVIRVAGTPDGDDPAALDYIEVMPAAR